MLKEIDKIIYCYDDKSNAGDVPVMLIDWKKESKVFKEIINVNPLTKDVPVELEMKIVALISSYVAAKSKGKNDGKAIIEAKK